VPAVVVLTFGQHPSRVALVQHQDVIQYPLAAHDRGDPASDRRWFFAEGRKKTRSFQFPILCVTSKPLLSAVELATAEWEGWHNYGRLHRAVRRRLLNDSSEPNDILVC